MKKLMVFVLVAFFTLGATAYADLNSGLVAYYPFNGNANDESGNGNNGVVNGATLTTDRFGNPNSAYQFDGQDDYISISDNGNLDGLNGLTVSAWVKLDQTPNAQNGLCSKGRFVNGEFHYAYLLQIQDGITTCQIYPDDGTGNGRKQIINKNTVSTGTWNHIVFTWSNTGTVQFFINGILDLSDSTDVPQMMASTSYDLNIGVNWNFDYGHKPWFKGLIDDFRTYNRPLSATEVQQLYWGGGRVSGNCPTCTQDFTQSDIDNAKQSGYDEGKKDGLEECEECPTAPDCIQDYTQTDIDNARQDGMNICKNDPASCGINTENPVSGECATINQDLSLNIPCAEFGTTQFYFNLLPYQNPNNPFDTNFYWMLDMSSLGVK